MATIEAAKRRACARDFVCVVDQSGSMMDEDRLEFVKLALVDLAYANNSNKYSIHKKNKS